MWLLVPEVVGGICISLSGQAIRVRQTLSQVVVSIIELEATFTARTRSDCVARAERPMHFKQLLTHQSHPTPCIGIFTTHFLCTPVFSWLKQLSEPTRHHPRHRHHTRTYALPAFPGPINTTTAKMIIRRRRSRRPHPSIDIASTLSALFLATSCFLASLSIQNAFLLPPPRSSLSSPSPATTTTIRTRRRPPNQAVSSLTADTSGEDGSPLMMPRRTPPPPWPRPGTTAPAPLFTPSELADLQERIQSGTNLDKAFQDLRSWRSSEEGNSPVPDALYRALLGHCRHARPPQAYATRNLGLAREVVQCYFTDALISSSHSLPLAEVQGVLQASSRAGDAEGALGLLQFLIGQSQERGGGAGPARMLLDEFLFFLVVKACCIEGDGGLTVVKNTRALSAVAPLLGEMEGLGIAKSSFLYSAALKGYGRMGWKDRVEEMGDEMLEKRSEVKVDLVAMNSLLDALARCGAVDRAQKILLEMARGRRSAPASEAAVATSLKTNVGEKLGAGPSVAYAAAAEAVPVLLPALPRPDLYSYNIVLRALCPNDLGGALSLYRDLKQEGIQPDAVTINTLVAGCVKTGNLKRALLILESSSVPASVEGYSALIGGFAARGKIKEAQEVLEKMVNGGLKPNVRTYTALLQGAAAVGEMGLVFETFGMMKEQGRKDPGVRPTVWTYNALMAALAKAGKVQAMLALKEEMSNPSTRAGGGAAAVAVAPDVVTCNTLLDALLFKCDPPRIRQAEMLFLEMLEDGPVPDQYTFSTLLRAYIPPLPSSRSLPPPRSPVDLLSRLPSVLLHRGGGRGGEDDPPLEVAAAEAAALDAAYTSAEPSPSEILPGPDRLLELMNKKHDLGLLLDTTAVNSLLLAFIKSGAIKRSLEVFHDFKKGNLTHGALVSSSPSASLPFSSSMRERRRGIPDVVTYTILVKGVAASDNMYAGAKIMQLYREMRREFGIAPDLQLAYALVNSFASARSRVGGLGMEDLEEVFNDLRELGWKKETLGRLEKRASSYEGLYSEAWKEGPARKGGRGAGRREEKASDRFFDKYGWNKFESGYNFFA